MSSILDRQFSPSTNPRPFSIREATTADVAAMAAFSEALAAEIEERPLDRAATRAALRALVKDRDLLGLLACDGSGTPVGMLTIASRETSDFDAGTRWWISSVYVAPAWRACGVFRALYAEARETAVASGVRALRLYALPTNEAANLAYSRVGMRPTHEIVWEDLLDDEPA